MEELDNVAAIRAVAARLEGLGLDRLERSLLDRVVLVTGASAGVFATVEEAGAKLRVGAVNGFHPAEVMVGQTYPVDGETLIGAAVVEEQTILVSPAELAARFPRVEVFDRPAVAWAALPVLLLDAPAAVVGLRFDEPLGKQPDDVVAQLEYALSSRVLVEQAKGFLAARHGVDTEAAYERLRHRARSASQPIHALAEDVVAGRADPFQPS